jgi:DNA topoisomerase I
MPSETYSRCTCFSRSSFSLVFSLSLSLYVRVCVCVCVYDYYYFVCFLLLFSLGFNENFFADWQVYLNESGKHPLIHSMDKCDFSLIHKHVMQQREQRRNRSKEEKAAERVLRQEEMEKYGYAMVDGRREKMASFRVEPPGLFLGRGDHPLTGKIKRRSFPEDVIINLDKDAPVPPAPDGHSWKEVVHIPTVTWLAEYRDHISNHRKVCCV